MKERVTKAVKEAVRELVEKAGADGAPEPVIEASKQEAHGDFATNAALALAKTLRRSPKSIAGDLAATLPGFLPELERTEIAGPGFLNLFLKPEAWQALIGGIAEKGAAYGNVDDGGGKRVLIEYVSANPTGPLHVGHGRGAAVGSVLAEVLKAAGWDVTSEYYVNDAGNQVQTLGRSVHARYLQALGHEAEWREDYYQGEYIKELAEEFVKKVGDKYVDAAEEEAVAFFIKESMEEVLGWIRKDLADLGVSFDRWFSEKSLYDGGLVEAALDDLRGKGFIYDKEGAVWFRSTDFGDEKDRVLVRENGVPTYFASDVAYHREKLERGFDRLINIWGADHHGYVKRVRASVKALGLPDEAFEVLLIQFVNLVRGGEAVSMGKRSGQFVTLGELLEEAGRDVTRFFFVMRSHDTTFEFDLDLAKSQVRENPVYYMQYSYARICSIFRKADEQGVAFGGTRQADLSLLTEARELALIKKLARFPETISSAARLLEIHHLPFYLQELAALFHNYYKFHRVLGEEAGLTQARLALVDAVRTVMARGLAILGVGAPERMLADDEADGADRLDAGGDS